MVPKKAQKVIYKMIKANNELIKIFKPKRVKFNQLDAYNQYLVMNMVLLEQFNHISFETDLFQKEYDDCYILFILPSRVFKFLQNINCTAEEKISFINWYITNFVKFYKERNFSCYARTYNIILKNVELFLMGKLEKTFLNNLITIDNNSPQLLETYNLEKKIADEMWGNEHNLNISYTRQYETLKKIGMSNNLISELKKYNEDNMPLEREISKNQVHTTSKEIVLPKETQAIPLFKGIQACKKNSSEKTSNIEKRRLSDILKKYFDVATLENIMVIEGEVLEEVLQIVNKLYPSELAHQYKKKILENNKKLLQEKELLEQIAKQKLYNETLKILLSSNNFILFQKIKELSDNTTFTSSTYEYILLEFIQNVNSLVFEYIEENDISLNNLYQEQIQLLFVEYQDYLSFENFMEENKRY